MAFTFNWEEFWKKDYWFGGLVELIINIFVLRLPRRDTWDDVPTKIPQLWTAVYFAIPILALRLFIEAGVGLQLGQWLGYVPEPLSEARRQYILGGFAQQTKRKKVCTLSFVHTHSGFRFLSLFGVLPLILYSLLLDVLC